MMEVDKMETLFAVINMNWVWAGPTMLLGILIALIQLIKDLFTV